VPLGARSAEGQHASRATEADLASPEVAAFAWVGAFVDELVRAGVRDA
jgi:hypothetical protein